MMFRYVKCFFKIIFNPNYRFLVLSEHGFYKHLEDSVFLKRKYKICFGEDLNLSNPKKYTEKIQWLKLYNRNDLYTLLVDKIKVKEWVAQKIGSEYVIPTIAVWNNPDEIDFNTLPSKYVLKCNHNSGLGMFISNGINKVDPKIVKRNLKKGLKENKYLPGREWAYKNVERKVFAEKYIEDSTTKDLKDYKFFAFNGEIKALFIASDRQNDSEETKFDFFDADFNHLNIFNGHPNSKTNIKKPKSFEKMKELASVLSKGIPHVRVDFYEVDGQVYFGEMTFYHWSGLVPFNPKEWDYIFGSWINFPVEMSGEIINR